MRTAHRLPLRTIPLGCAFLSLGIFLGAASRAADAQTLHASAKLVVVDVTVTDSRGNPVKGLKPEDFHLLEDKKPQTIRSFEEHASTPDRRSASPQLTLNPGVLTNIDTAPASPVNILLIDMLNTPMSSQALVHGQLLKYLRAAKPGARMAVFALTDHLIMLQGITNDLTALHLAVERSHPEKSMRTDPNNGSGGLIGAQTAGIEAQIASEAPGMVNALDAFNAADQYTETSMSVEETMLAMHQLARYLAGIPGRKNLIWFSDSFPLTLNPELHSGPGQPGEDRLSGTSHWTSEYRETVDLFTRARVAIYPVDARGLSVQPRMSGSQFEARSTMLTMAEATGGSAFFNTNGFADAVAQVVDSGANFYTLAYTPTDHNEHGEYRSIRIHLDGGYTLAYRRGYFADPDDAPPAPSADTVKLALSYTAPPATQIPFFARVQPSPPPPPAEAEGIFTPANQTASPDAPRRLLEPNRFVRYQVEYSADPRSLSVSASADGLRHSHLEYIVLVYDPQGKIVNTSVKDLQATWTPAQFDAALRRGVRYQMEIGVPPGDASSLRIILHDLTDDRIGSIDVPSSRLEKPSTQTP